MRLRTKFGIVLLVVTLVLSGTVYGGLELYKDRVVQQTRDDVNETATLTAGQLDAAIEDRKDFIGFAASRDAAARFERSDRFLDAFVGNSRFFAAQIVAANGTIVDFHGDITQNVQQESLGTNVRERPYVAAPLDGMVYVSEPEYVNATDSYLVIFSAPIFEDRRVKGALAGAIYLDRQTFFGVLGPISRDDQHVTVTAGEDTLYRSGDRFDESIEQTATVSSTGWTVTVDRDRSRMTTRIQELATVQIMGLLFVMLSVTIFGVWEYRTTLTQTRKLLDGFAALEEGAYTHKLTLAAAEEWEQISRGFNALAVSLQEREARLNQREQRLQVLNRALRHNLRNSASVILGYAGMIQEGTTEQSVLNAADSIESAADDLEALSRKASQLETTIAERDPVSMDVTRMVSDVVASFRATYPEVEFDVDLPTSRWVRADPSLRLALENLCENACEHNESPEPRLEVAVEGDESEVSIRVEDNAGGIPDHELAVLEIGEETPLRHGSGLGLWIVQWAVERSGGSIDFESIDGHGSVVQIDLVRAAVDEDHGHPVTNRDAATTASDDSLVTGDGAGLSGARDETNPI